MDWSRHRGLSERWRRESQAYAAAINAYVARGASQGWEAAGEQPPDTRGDMAETVLAIARQANTTGDWRSLRGHFPPAHEPFVPWLRERATAVLGAVWVDEQRVVARVGAPWDEKKGTFLFGWDGSVEPLPGVLRVARSPDGHFFAVLREKEIEVRRGFWGPVIRRLPLPTGREGLPPELASDPNAPPALQDFRLFPEGTAALLVRTDGVLVARAAGAQRLYPGPEEIERELEDGAEARLAGYDMMHAAVSPDGRLVALGHQDSQHLIFQASGARVACFGPVLSSYPHHAAFSPDGAVAIFNSCHLYGGASVAVRTQDLERLHLEPYQEDPRLRLLEEGSRVYASTFQRGAFLLGDAYGYLRAVSTGGEPRWQHFCGSSIAAVDLSPSGRRLAVSTYAGYLQLIAVDQPEPDPFQIGTARHREWLRFVHWKGMPLLRW